MGPTALHVVAAAIDMRRLLVVADTAVALVDLIEFERNAYMLDTGAIRHLLEAATTTAPRYTPNATWCQARRLDTLARYARWQKAYCALRKRRPQMSDVWYARQAIAEGYRVDTIHRHMTCAPGAQVRRR